MLRAVQETSTLQAAGGGALLLALAALLSLSLSAWVLRNTRGEKKHEAALPVAVGASVLLGVFFALALSAFTASKIGARAWLGADHPDLTVVDVFDRAIFQLTRGRALMRVAKVLVWAPLLASLVALWRAGIHGRGTGARIATTAVALGLLVGTNKLFSHDVPDPREEAYGIFAPKLALDLRADLATPPDDARCKKLEGAVTIIGATKLTADVPTSRDAARTCIARRRSEGAADDVLRASPLSQLSQAAP